ncbi:MAG TPA: hypothetical protein DEF47_19915 [Herpetosiphon sp.]|uniref:Uncharacterized protein n=1 Tax=Herpetosiphon aurantiacus (strain ATCC 23779 / DSM 785 / 114-95) TaxID=316274 RepID=A9B3P0_HERA2|nr:hypothetical protein [Herpetosiphon sp.]ABX05612.1 hypothetical protein Haur_2974 [Herpetosiphon aurantiacus DSM 785]HBW52160.1 hypothetical protein [Herpetosiphon sp.]
MAVFVEQEAILELLQTSRAASLAAMQYVQPADLAQLIALEQQATYDCAAHANQSPQLVDAANSLDQWQQQRQQLAQAIAAIPWAGYTQRIQTAAGALYLGELVKRLIAAEHQQLSQLLHAGQHPAIIDQWAD